ncbi:hypothetical protein J6590_013251 [Homalodisca vitripennis]|nr:hypothetical protein J6590_013251 [Homalodisca vitripennis]
MTFAKSVVTCLLIPLPSSYAAAWKPFTCADRTTPAVVQCQHICVLTNIVAWGGQWHGHSCADRTTPAVMQCQHICVLTNIEAWGGQGHGHCAHARTAPLRASNSYHQWIINRHEGWE